MKGPGRPDGTGAGTLTVRAPAKVNLFLRVLAQETSGYHQIETLFQGLELHDTIQVERRPEPGVILEVVGSGGETGPELPDDLGPVEENLAYRAAMAYRKRAGLETEPGVSIRLEKAIPAGAGMGGGSSDAAAVLRALDAIHDGTLDTGALMTVAVGLGSDVPFFLGPGPLALAWGRGERLLGLPPLESRPVVVAVPEWRMSTADAYEALARQRSEGAAGERVDGGGEPLTVSDLSFWDEVGHRSVNDFEGVVLSERPQGREILALLRGSGASPGLLSGSGSAFFGVYPDGDRADGGAERLASTFPGLRVLRTATLEAWPPIVTS